MAYTLTEIGVPEFEFDLEQNSATAVRKLRLEPWSELDNAINDLAGGSLSMGSLVIVTQPVKYPGKDYLWLLNIKVKPFHECVGDLDSNDVPEDPAGAELTLNYKTPRFEQGTNNLPQVPVDTYLTVERNQSLEFVSEDVQGLFYDAQYGGGDPYVVPGSSTVVSGETLWYGGAPLPLDASASSTIAVGDIRVTWHRVKDPPWRAIMALQGMVNDDFFMDYSEEQVMFVGVSDRRQFQTNGTDLWQITYQFNIRIPKFKYRDYDERLKKWLPTDIATGGWNHFPRKGTSGDDPNPMWQKVYRVAGTSGSPQSDKDLLFLKGDFRKLFEPDPDSN